MAVTIELNDKLAALAGGVVELQVTASTVKEAVIALAKLHRPIGARLFNCEGDVRSVVKVEINGQPVAADAATAALADGDHLSLAFP